MAHHTYTALRLACRGRHLPFRSHDRTLVCGGVEMHGGAKVETCRDERSSRVTGFNNVATAETRRVKHSSGI